MTSPIFSVLGTEKTRRASARRIRSSVTASRFFSCRTPSDFRTMFRFRSERLAEAHNRRKALVSFSPVQGQTASTVLVTAGEAWVGATLISECALWKAGTRPPISMNHFVTHSSSVPIELTFWRGLSFPQCLQNFSTPPHGF